MTFTEMPQKAHRSLRSDEVREMGERAGKGVKTLRERGEKRVLRVLAWRRVQTQERGEYIYNRPATIAKRKIDSRGPGGVEMRIFNPFSAFRAQNWPSGESIHKTTTNVISA